MYIYNQNIKNNFCKDIYMQLIIVTIFYLLTSSCAYAADVPTTKVSSAEAKTEEVIQDNNKLALTYPIENGFKTYLLDIKENEPITITEFKDLFDEEDKKGIPAFLCLFTYIEKNKEFSRIFEWRSFKKCLNKKKEDPLTRNPINAANFRYFLVRNRNNANPPAYKATFLFSGDDSRNINPLNQALNQFDQKDHHSANLELNRAAFYTDVTRGYTQSHPKLALKFAKFGLEGIQGEQQGLLTVYRNSFLRTAGDIHANQGNHNAALICYRQAINLNDSYSVAAISKLCNELGGNYISEQIELFKEKATTESDKSFLQTIYTHILPLYEKIGNQEAADDARTKIIDLNNSINNSFKRQRANSPIPEQNNLQVTPKRARENTPN